MSNELKTLVIYVFSAFVVLTVIEFFDEGFFYDSPFEICRVITDHYYKDIYYGGLRNYFGLFGWYLLTGFIVFAFAWPTAYLINTYLFKSYFLQANIKPKNIYKKYTSNKENIFSFILIFFVMLPLPVLIYDLIPLLYYDYSCEEIIKFKESLY